ncbi:L,D-transpeptidase family protein [Sphingomonas sp. ASY06-1R]|uniref:L,D-transpeptidase family protein n=1 Tax=Sphingomonas sp. ASY06-1R TaxID=3445771 RepID=UPI003FA31120
MADNMLKWRRRLAGGVTGLVAMSLQAAPVLAQDVAPSAAPAVPAIVPAPVQIPKLSRSQMDDLRTALAQAEAQGLTDRTLTSDEARSGDQVLISAILDYARAVHAGQLDAGDFLREWGLRPAPYDPRPSFAAAVTQDKLRSWLASLTPPYAGYDGLRRGLATYRQIEADGGWPRLAPGPDLLPGADGPRVIALRTRLAVEDKAVSTDGDTFDDALLEAVRRAQRRYGLNPSGIVSTQTIAALNVPVSVRIRQILANMERWRWLPPQLARNRIQVNIAAAVLTVFDGDAPVKSMRAVTGRPGDETPMLQSTITSIVLNPPWNVPTSIATKELWPKEKANPGYFKRNGFKVISLADGGSRLQQQAGTKSALGRYKFDFDNPYSVYLHDTPTQATFSLYSRLSSHGCVRLEKPAELAELLLKDAPDWSPDAIKAAITKGDTVRARLQTPVAVYLLYWTAFASANGQISFRGDPYGWDSGLMDKIDGRDRKELVADVLKGVR